MRLFITTGKLVHLLPIGTCGMFGKRPRWDYRIICNCQKHAGRRRIRRIASAAAKHLKRRSVMLLIGLPLAFGALGLPMEAMNITLPELADRIAEQTLPARELPIFTTRKVREAFLDPQRTHTWSLEVAKEQFFQSEIPYGSIIYSEARKNNLPPELIAAVVSAESDFRPLLVSHKQAQGLMQIVPETGRILGCENLFNPAENVAAGTRYLRYLMDRFGGDQTTALAAYNAGEGNVERFGGVPPFPETIDYLERVTYRSHAYRRQIHNRFNAVRMQRTFIE